MAIIVMRHGLRGQEVDSPLLTYQPSNPEISCPEIWKTIHGIAPYVQRQQLRAIVVSPYLRTRQTAELVQHGLLQLTGQYLPITVDLRVGEYNHRRCSWNLPTREDFDPETWKLYRGQIPLCRESPEMFSLRVYRFYQTLQSNTLVVTHNGVATLLGQCMGLSVGLGMGHYSLLQAQQEVS
jgi:broad specificity phosphatase PhoE